MKCIYLLLLIVSLSSCDFRSDEEKIIETFNTYKKGILQDDPELATSKLYSTNTYNYFDEILFSIREDDSTELIRMPAYHRLVVLLSRHLFSIESINNLTDEKFIQLLITEDFIDKKRVLNNSLG